ncbi:MAG: DUF992 domain-containing protein [Paracoccaceae bacterium]
MIRTATALSLISALVAADAVAQDEKFRVELGVLTCRLTDRTNLVIVSETEFACIFDHADDRPDERFDGVIDKIGVDLTFKDDETLVWGVLAPSIDAQVSSMEGVYAGIGADVAVGVGIGANLLVGGLDKSFALQPVSLSGSEGVGATLAVESFKLDYVGVVN